MKLQNPHDKFFRESLGTVEAAKDFITHYFPESIRQVLDLNTLDIQSGTFIDEELTEHVSDLLFKVNICNQEGYLYLLFEHKSYIAQDVAYQLLKYMMKIWDLVRKEKAKSANELPIILPLVVYHGKREWRVASSLAELLQGYEKLPETIKTYVPNFEYVLFDTSQYKDEDIKGSVRTRILMTLLRDILTKTGEELNASIVHAMRYLHELEESEHTASYIRTLMRYILNTAEDFTKEHFEEIVKELTTTHKEGSEIAMTLAELLKREGFEQGIEKGIEQGIEQGIEKGKLEIVKNMIRKGYSNEMIADLSDLNMNEVEQLRKELYV